MRAQFHSGQGSSISYELSKHSGLGADQVMEAALLERAVRSNVRTIITNDVGVSSHVYELLADLTATEDVDFSTYLFGHRIFKRSSVKKDGDNVITADDCIKEVGSINKMLEKCSLDKNRLKQLDFITLPPNLYHESDIPHFKLLGTQLIVGMDFTTDYILESSEEAIIDEVKRLSDGVKVITIATNFMTIMKASKVIAFAKQCNAIVVSTETLRIHSKRPGLLSVISGCPSHHNIRKITQYNTPEGVSAALRTSVDNLRRSMDSCMHVEKIYLDRLQGLAPNVKKTSLCLAHVLVQAQKNIQFPEEFNFIINSQLEPNLLAAIEEMKKANKETSSWTTLYTPMSRHLMSAFHDYLQLRKYSLCFDVSRQLNVSLNYLQVYQNACNINVFSNKVTAENIELILLFLSHFGTKTDYVTFTSAEVHLTKEIHRFFDSKLRDDINTLDSFAHIEAIIKNYIDGIL